jgi:hypothetical protein
VDLVFKFHDIIEKENASSDGWRVISAKNHSTRSSAWRAALPLLCLVRGVIVDDWQSVSPRLFP